jgi:hypothetical protein
VREGSRSAVRRAKDRIERRDSVAILDGVQVAVTQEVSQGIG